jgi:exo-beta-1,3-glucanase (GH17 family)/glycosyltransferase involved in cell wall biosynthesis
MNSALTVVAPGAKRGSFVSRWLLAFAVAALVALTNALAWQWANPPLAAPDAPRRVAGLAYNAFGRWDSPIERRFPEDAQIEADLRKLAPLSDRLRTYSSAELPALPAIAETLGLQLTAGVWLDRRADNNEREIAAIANALLRRTNIERVIVGNEVLLRGELSVRELSGYLDKMQKLTRTPVSTAEPWHIWMKHPELAKHVDFITVHLLPYWEGVPAGEAVDYALMRLEEMRKRFPKKTIVVGEIGWPSAGEDVPPAAKASPADQALFMRQFLAKVQGRKLDYFVMEAVDQPWKAETEGKAGAYWGLLDASRLEKFELSTGAVEADPLWRRKAAASTLLGFALSFAFCAAFPRMRLAGRLTFAAGAQALVALLVALAGLPFAYYLRPLDWALLALLTPVVAMLTATLLAQGFEFAELFWPGSLQRRFGRRPVADDASAPFVSVHLACCNEPPEMVIATIDSVRALDYPNFELIVVSNNTRDPSVWQPVEAHLQRVADARVRFFHLETWPGYKAGALNFALQQTDARADVVGVVDADYLVEPDWLRALAGHFQADARVAVVQSPQAHRGWAGGAFTRMMNWEYDGFFRVGMHHRNERDAIIQHGTMTLVRADALREYGRWSEWCICEDSELGLRLMQRGLKTVYVDEVFGQGLVPDDFAAYKKQRRRWAEGAMQICRAHARALFRGDGSLTPAQRYHFVAGWLPWVGDALHLLFSFAAMAWTVAMLADPETFRTPLELLLVPLAVFFAMRLVAGPLLYAARVPCSGRDAIGAALAGMALSHAVARGAGVARRGVPRHAQGQEWRGGRRLARRGARGGRAGTGHRHVHRRPEPGHAAARRVVRAVDRRAGAARGAVRGGAGLRGAVALAAAPGEGRRSDRAGGAGRHRDGEAGRLTQRAPGPRGPAAAPRQFCCACAACAACARARSSRSARSRARSSARCANCSSRLATSFGSSWFHASTSAAATGLACGVSSQPPCTAMAPPPRMTLPSPTDSLVPRPKAEATISLVRASTALITTSASRWRDSPSTPPMALPNSAPSAPLLPPVCSTKTISPRST